MSSLDKDNFAKVFIIGTTQILIYWSPEGEEGWRVNQIMQSDAGEINMSLMFENEKDAADFFYGYDQDMAEQVYNNLNNQANGIFK